MAQLPGDARVKQYTASGGQTVFIYDFLVYAPVEILVQQDSTTLILTTDYTVQDAGEDAGGTITLVVGATDGDIITLTGNSMIERDTEFTEGGDFLASAINGEYDKLDNITSEILTDQGQNFRLDVYSETVSTTIPIPEARKALVWNSAALALENTVYDPDEQVLLCEALVALCEAETAKCVAETALCEAETELCIAETAKCVALVALASGFAGDASDSADDAAASAASIDPAAFGSDLIPDDDSIRDLGSTSHRWKDIFGDDGVFTDTLKVGDKDVLTTDNVTSFAQFEHVVTGSGNGGTYNQGNHTTRPINTEVTNDITGCSLASNQITLEATGTYEIEYWFVSSQVGVILGELYQVSPGGGTIVSEAIGNGTTETHDLNFITNDRVRVTIAETTVFTIRMYAVATEANTGMGRPVTGTNRYLMLRIVKVL